MEQILHQRQNQVSLHKHYFERSWLNSSFLLLVVVLVPAFWLGWKAGGEKWVSKMTTYLSELVTLAFSAYFKKRLTHYLNNQ